MVVLCAIGRRKCPRRRAWRIDVGARPARAPTRSPPPATQSPSHRLAIYTPMRSPRKLTAHTSGFATRLHCSASATRRCNAAPPLWPSCRATRFLLTLDGQESLAAGLVERAAASYDHAAKLTPGDADALVNAGIALTAAGRPKEAVERLRASLALSPQSVAAYTELGRALEANRGDRDAADAACEARKHASLLAPKSAALKLDYGNALLSAQRHAEAATVMEAALKLSPDGSSRSLRALAYFGLGRASMGRGDACAARNAFSEASLITPTDADNWHHFGVAAFRCDKDYVGAKACVAARGRD